MRASVAARQRRVVAAVVPLLVPDYPVLDAAARLRVVDDVITFVGAQIGRLPDFLRLPYGMALLAFDASAAARYRRPFHALDAEARAGWLARWSDGPLGATRNFVKLMRSCALLAYFDHPIVRAALERERHAGDATEPTTAAAS
jgi:hypothetical protein